VVVFVADAQPMRNEVRRLRRQNTAGRGRPTRRTVRLSPGLFHVRSVRPPTTHRRPVLSDGRQHETRLQGRLPEDQRVQSVVFCVRFSRLIAIPITNLMNLIWTFI